MSEFRGEERGKDELHGLFEGGELWECKDQYRGSAPTAGAIAWAPRTRGRRRKKPLRIRARCRGKMSIGITQIPTL